MCFLLHLDNFNFQSTSYPIATFYIKLTPCCVMELAQTFTCTSMKAFNEHFQAKTAFYGD